MTSDFLADLDAAVQQRCACRCGRPITDTSPSAYFAYESCAQRWHRRTAGVTIRPAAPAVVIDFLPLFRQFAEMTSAVLDAAIGQVEAVLAPLGRDIGRFFERAARMLQLEPQPPAGVMERALHLRRTRNTGPRPSTGVPRRIDPAGGLRSLAQGRPAYRPAS